MCIFVGVVYCRACFIFETQQLQNYALVVASSQMDSYSQIVLHICDTILGLQVSVFRVSLLYLSACLFILRVTNACTFDYQVWYVMLVSILNFFIGSVFHKVANSVKRQSYYSIVCVSINIVFLLPVISILTTKRYLQFLKLYGEQVATFIRGRCYANHTQLYQNIQRDCKYTQLLLCLCFKILSYKTSFNNSVTYLRYNLNQYEIQEQYYQHQYLIFGFNYQAIKWTYVGGRFQLFYICRKYADEFGAWVLFSNNQVCFLLQVLMYDIFLYIYFSQSCTFLHETIEFS
eukprot:TRINITY_DN8831_c0_g1_i1.p1 TRINITY_DN8831_c0_g1~~TRINITY_DN8831_c0_g1_i1.p1  ORF type:complete len:289 (+),score=-18.12 TRINITY_DN8831_c0_g1_i1:1038-1904(+)